MKEYKKRPRCKRGHLWREKSTAIKNTRTKNGKLYKRRVCLFCKSIYDRRSYEKWTKAKMSENGLTTT